MSEQRLDVGLDTLSESAKWGEVDGDQVQEEIQAEDQGQKEVEAEDEEAQGDTTLPQRLTRSKFKELEVVVDCFLFL